MLLTQHCSTHSRIILALPHLCFPERCVLPPFALPFPVRQSAILLQRDQTARQLLRPRIQRGLHDLLLPLCLKTSKQQGSVKDDT